MISQEQRRAMRMQNEMLNPRLRENEAVVPANYVRNLEVELDRLRAIEPELDALRIQVEVEKIDVSEISTNKEITDEPIPTVEDAQGVQQPTPPDNQTEPGIGDETQPSP